MWLVSLLGILGAVALLGIIAAMLIGATVRNEMKAFFLF